MFRINFKLKKPAEIKPWGELNPSLHWFGLTDSLLWIDISNSVIYEDNLTKDRQRFNEQKVKSEYYFDRSY